MKQIESKIYHSWMNDRPHTSTYGKDCSDNYRDVVVVRDDGTRVYILCGVTLCFRNIGGTFYFYVTSVGNRHSYICMSQTSKSRINALLPYGCITQKNHYNYFHLTVSFNGKVSKKEIKLEVGYWYKLKDGSISRIEGIPLSLSLTN